jgi:hypothetical protein
MNPTEPGLLPKDHAPHGRNSPSHTGSANHMPPSGQNRGREAM